MWRSVSILLSRKRDVGGERMVVIEEERERLDRSSVTPEFLCTCGMCAVRGSQSPYPPFFPTRTRLHYRTGQDGPFERGLHTW